MWSSLFDLGFGPSDLKNILLTFQIFLSSFFIWPSTDPEADVMKIYQPSHLFIQIVSGVQMLTRDIIYCPSCVKGNYQYFPNVPT